jgi:hypothetical protein
MDSHTSDQWITRQELAERYGLPVKDACSVGIQGDGPSLREVRSTRPISLE